MNLVQRMELWGDRHHPKWLDVVRIGLGIFLMAKGIQFLSNTSMIVSLTSDKLSFQPFWMMMLTHFIVFAHILGGFLLTLGLLTRFACIIQIPIVLGAVVFLNSSSGVFRPFSETLIAILVLLLLILFTIVGNGPWSFDWFIRREGGNDHEEKY